MPNESQSKRFLEIINVTKQLRFSGKQGRIVENPNSITSQIFSLVLGIISLDSYFLSTAMTTPSLTLMPIDEFPSFELIISKD